MLHIYLNFHPQHMNSYICIFHASKPESSHFLSSTRKTTSFDTNTSQDLTDRRSWLMLNKRTLLIRRLWISSMAKWISFVARWTSSYSTFILKKRLLLLLSLNSYWKCCSTYLKSTELSGLSVLYVMYPWGMTHNFFPPTANGCAFIPYHPMHVHSVNGNFVVHPWGIPPIYLLK